MLRLARGHRAARWAHVDLIMSWMARIGNVIGEGGYSGDVSWHVVLCFRYADVAGDGDELDGDVDEHDDNADGHGDNDGRG